MASMPKRLSDKLDMHSTLKQIRLPYEQMWQEIGDRLAPDQSIFNRQFTPGGKRTQFMFDATAPLALSRYGAAMESMLTPRTQRWHQLRERNPDLNDRQDVQEWNEKVTDILFAQRYSPHANFASQAQECYLSNGAWGTGIMYIDDMMGYGMRYKSCHLAECFIAENFSGIVDMLHRQYKYTARQAVQAFGIENVPEGVRKQYEKEPLTEQTYIHCVYPNQDYDRRARGGLSSLRFLSMQICRDEPYICREGNGYRRFPYAISRNLTLPCETYGRGPASLVLPDIKQLNEFEKVMLRQGQLAVDPPILLSEDGSLTGFNMQPGALIWGGMNADGEALAKPFMTGARLDINEKLMDNKRKVINDAFLVTLFQILVENPQMTATEAMLRAQEKGQLLAPTMGRNQSEFLGPIIEREIEILEASGMLPPKPAILEQMGEGLEVEYVSPLNRAQMADEGVAIAQTLQFAQSFAPENPKIMRIFKDMDAIRKVAQVNGMESNLLYSDEELAKQDQQSQISETVQNTIAASQPASVAAKNFAQAQALAASTPSQAAPAILPN